jgi:RNA-directed DNA polymerase
MRDRLPPTPFSFGGERGRDARRNLLRHRRSTFAYTTDIRGFFPTISRHKVGAIFAGRLRCNEEVAGLIARLCTHGGRLAQGLITSPIIASEAASRIDARIGGMCKKQGLRYTRFVDDITISGPLDFEEQARDLAELAEQIIRESGFVTAKEKRQAGRIDRGEVTVTGLRVLGGCVDVEASYLNRLQDDVKRHSDYARGEPLSGPLFTKEQLSGRAGYVRRHNRQRGGVIAAAVERVPWPAVVRRAGEEGLLIARKSLRPHRAGVLDRGAVA